MILQILLQTHMFQFTHPGRGATETFAFRYAVCGVSIHAPREGCDGEVTFTSVFASKFQFTHPGRGATVVRPLSLVIT